MSGGTGAVEPDSDARCDVHGQPLQRGTAEVIWGLPVVSEVEWRARAALFPNAHTHAYGGCMLPAAAPSEIEVRFCSACRQAASAWRLPPELNNDSPTLIWD